MHLAAVDLERLPVQQEVRFADLERGAPPRDGAQRKGKKDNKTLDAFHRLFVMTGPFTSFAESISKGWTDKPHPIG